MLLRDSPRISGNLPVPKNFAKPNSNFYSEEKV